jgi:hypothetical protein
MDTCGRVRGVCAYLVEQGVQFRFTIERMLDKMKPCSTCHRQHPHRKTNSRGANRIAGHLVGLELTFPVNLTNLGSLFNHASGVPASFSSGVE